MESNGDGDVKLKLPIGFRFYPTDEELLLHYLKRKICSMPLPATVIPELDVFTFNPWNLPGDIEEKRYFFCKSVASNKCISGSVDAGSGYWKDTGKSKQIMSRAGTNNNNNLVVIGLRRSLVFNKSEHRKTRWMMHEFCLVGYANPASYSTQKLMMRQVGEWVVCCIYQRKSRNQYIARTRTRTLVQGCPDPTSSPCSSGITEISADDLDQEIIRVGSSDNVS